MSNFSFENTPLRDAVLITPKRFGDERGFFMETYRRDTFSVGGVDIEFVQDNCSRSVKGVLRGLHFQKNAPQGKLVRVTTGEVLDVAVDLRVNSPSFGKHFAVHLSAENGVMFYVPAGFAHGFCVLSEVAEFTYKCTDYYNPSDEGGIVYNDKTLSIDWELDISPSLSAKDAALSTFNDQDFSYYSHL